MAVELAISCSGEPIVGVAWVDFVRHNEDIITFSHSMSDDDWTCVLHSLAHLRHFLRLILNLLLNLSLCLRCKSGSRVLIRKTDAHCNELLSFLLFVGWRRFYKRVGFRILKINLPSHFALDALEGFDTWEVAFEWTEAFDLTLGWLEALDLCDAACSVSFSIAFSWSWFLLF